MAYRLPDERVDVFVDDIQIEVSPLNSEVIALHGLTLAEKAGPDNLDALLKLYGLFVAEAQPTWAILDACGPILPTRGGMLRLPLAVGLGMVQGWLATLPVQQPTVADEVLPDGPVKDEVNAALRAAKRKGRRG